MKFKRKETKTTKRQCQVGPFVRLLLAHLGGLLYLGINLTPFHSLLAHYYPVFCIQNKHWHCLSFVIWLSLFIGHQQIVI